MNSFEQLKQLCEMIEPLDERYLQLGKKHWDQIAKPLNGLGLLEKSITRIVAIQQNEQISIAKKAVVVMCADNGIVAEGVTQSGSEVTAIVAENMAQGIASINRMADMAGADVIPVDIGIAGTVNHPGLINRKVSQGTNNFFKCQAMTREQTLTAILSGIQLVGELKEQGYQLLATGEMGIGNTTTSSAVSAVLLGRPADQLTGKGAGLSSAGMARKIQVIKEAITLHNPEPADPIAVLSAVGGLDIAGLTGVILGGALHRIPIVLDGVISLTAALAAKRICPFCAMYMLASHLGKEPASKFMIAELELEPVIYADLALGEGTGAVLLFPMLDMVNQVYMENTTFADIHIGAYQELK